MNWLGCTVTLRLLVAACCALAIVQDAVADGGIVIDRGRCGEHEMVIYADRPPAVGEVDISVLLSRDGRWAGDESVSLLMRSASGELVRATLEQNPSGERLLRSATVNIAQAGVWKIDVWVDPAGGARRSFEIAVAEAPPRWQEMILWGLLWIPVAVVIILRELLVRRQRSERGAWVQSQ